MGGGAGRPAFLSTRGREHGGAFVLGVGVGQVHTGFNSVPIKVRVFLVCYSIALALTFCFLYTDV